MSKNRYNYEALNNEGIKYAKAGKLTEAKSSFLNAIKLKVIIIKPI